MQASKHPNIIPIALQVRGTKGGGKGQGFGFSGRFGIPMELRLMFRAGERRVLVVDDDPGVLSLLRHTLETVGYEVHTAPNGKEALGLWLGNCYALVITDLVLAFSEGVDLIRSIRKLDQQVPILAITGFGQEVAQEALDAGADHVLRKPFHLFEVRELMRRLIH